MHLLLATPDRDLLRCYQKILEDIFDKITVAFDGTQTLALLSSEQFDFVILDENLPRIHARRIVRILHQKHTPVIVLLSERVTMALLSEEILANAYLSYPFLPEELMALVRNVLEKWDSEEYIAVADVKIVAFRLQEGPYLTVGEWDVLHALTSDTVQKVEKADVLIGSINQKLKGMGKRIRIVYRSGEGFQLVKKDG